MVKHISHKKNKSAAVGSKKNRKPALNRPSAKRKQAKATPTVTKTQTRKSEDNERKISAEQIDSARAMIKNAIFYDFISKTVGSRANDILGALCDTPQPDERLAEKLNIKLNETRRMLNLLNGHGIVRYDVNKDQKGWLTFRWYVDHDALGNFYENVLEREERPRSVLPEDCNDFFMCALCYEKQRIVFPFDVAYENGFKCECGKELRMITRAEAETKLES